MNLTSIKLQCCDTKLSVTISPDTIHFKCSIWTSLRITQLETDIQHKRLRTQTWGGSLTHSFKQCNCWLILWHNAHIHMYTAIGQLYNETQKNATRIPQITEKGIFFCIWSVRPAAEYEYSHLASYRPIFSVHRRGKDLWCGPTASFTTTWSMWRQQYLQRQQYWYRK